MFFLVVCAVADISIDIECGIIVRSINSLGDIQTPNSDIRDGRGGNDMWTWLTNVHEPLFVYRIYNVADIKRLSAHLMFIFMSIFATKIPNVLSTSLTRQPKTFVFLIGDSCFPIRTLSCE